MNRASSQRFSHRESKDMDYKYCRKPYLSVISQQASNFEDLIKISEQIIPRIFPEHNDSVDFEYLYSSLFKQIDEQYKALSVHLDPNSVDYNDKSARETSKKLQELFRIEFQRLEDFKYKSLQNVNLAAELILYMFDQEEFPELLSLLTILQTGDSGTLMSYQWIKNYLFPFKKAYLNILDRYPKILESKCKASADKAAEEAVDQLKARIRKLNQSNPLTSEILSALEKGNHFISSEIIRIKKLLLHENDLNNGNEELIYEICGLVSLIININSFFAENKADLYANFFNLQEICYKNFDLVQDKTYEKPFFSRGQWVSKLYIYLNFIFQMSISEQAKALSVISITCRLCMEDSASLLRDHFLDRSRNYPYIQILKQIRKLRPELVKIQDYSAMGKNYFSGLLWRNMVLLDKFLCESEDKFFFFSHEWIDYKEEFLEAIHIIHVELEELISFGEIWDCRYLTVNWVLTNFFGIVQDNESRPCEKVNFKRACKSYFDHTVQTILNPEEFLVKKEFQSENMKVYFECNCDTIEPGFDLDFQGRENYTLASDFFNSLNESNLLTLLKELFYDDSRLKKFIALSPDYLASLCVFFMKIIQEQRAVTIENVEALLNCSNYFSMTEDIGAYFFYEISQGFDNTFYGLTGEIANKIIEVNLNFQRIAMSYVFDPEWRIFSNSSQFLDEWENKKVVQSCSEVYKEFVGKLENELNHNWDVFTSLALEKGSLDLENWEDKLSRFAHQISCLMNNVKNFVYQINTENAEEWAEGLIKKSRSVMIHPVFVLFNRFVDDPTIITEIGPKSVEFLQSEIEKILEPWISMESNIDIGNFVSLIENPYMSLLENDEMDKIVKYIRFTESEYKLLMVFRIARIFNLGECDQYPTFHTKVINVLLAWTINMIKAIDETSRYEILILSRYVNIILENNERYNPVIEVKLLDKESKIWGVRLFSTFLLASFTEKENMEFFFKNLLPLYIEANDNEREFLFPKMKSFVELDQDFEPFTDIAVEACKKDRKLFKNFEKLIERESKINFQRYASEFIKLGLMSDAIKYVTTEQFKEFDLIKSFSKILGDELKSAYWYSINSLDPEEFSKLEGAVIDLKFVNLEEVNDLADIISIPKGLYINFIETAYRIQPEFSKDLEILMIDNLQSAICYSNILWNCIIKALSRVDEMQLSAHLFTSYFKFLSTDLEIRNIYLTLAKAYDKLNLSIESDFIVVIKSASDSLISLKEKGAKNSFKNWKGLWSIYHTLFRLDPKLFLEKITINDIFDQLSIMYFAEESIEEEAISFILTLIGSGIPPEIQFQASLINVDFRDSGLKHLEKKLDQILPLNCMDKTAFEGVIGKFLDPDSEFDMKFKEDDCYFEDFISKTSPFVKDFLKILINTYTSQLVDSLNGPLITQQNFFLQTIFVNIFHKYQYLKFYIAFLEIDLPQNSSEATLIKCNINRKKATFLEILFKIGIRFDYYGTNQILKELIKEDLFISKGDKQPMYKIISNNLHYYIVEAFNNDQNDTQSLTSLIWFSYIIKLEEKCFRNIVVENDPRFFEFRSTIFNWILRQNIDHLKSTQLFANFFEELNNFLINGDAKKCYPCKAYLIVNYPLEVFDIIKEKCKESTENKIGNSELITLDSQLLVSEESHSDFLLENSKVLGRVENVSPLNNLKFSSLRIDQYFNSFKTNLDDDKLVAYFHRKFNYNLSRNSENDNLYSFSKIKNFEAENLRVFKNLLEEISTKHQNKNQSAPDSTSNVSKIEKEAEPILDENIDEINFEEIKITDDEFISPPDPQIQEVKPDTTDLLPSESMKTEYSQSQNPEKNQLTQEEIPPTENAILQSEGEGEKPGTEMNTEYTLPKENNEEKDQATENKNPVTSNQFADVINQLEDEIGNLEDDGDGSLEDQELYKYFVGVYYKEFSDLEKAIKVHASKLKVYKEGHTLNKYLAREKDHSLTLEWFQTQKFSTDFEKYSILLMLATQNVIPISSNLKNEASPIVQEFKKIKSNPYDFIVYSIKFKKSKSGSKEECKKIKVIEDKEKESEDLGDNSENEEEQVEGSEKNANVNRKSSKKSENGEEDKNDDEEKSAVIAEDKDVHKESEQGENDGNKSIDIKSLLTDISDMNNSNFLNPKDEQNSDEKPEESPEEDIKQNSVEKIEENLDEEQKSDKKNQNWKDSFLMRNDFDMEGNWLIRNRKIEFKTSAKYTPLSEDLIQQISKFEKSSFTQISDCLKFFFYHYENLKLLDSVCNILYVILDHDYNRLIFLDALFFIAHTPKLFEDAHLEKSTLHKLIHSHKSDYNPARSNFLVNSLYFLEELCSRFNNINPNYITTKGLEELNVLKEEYKYFDFLAKYKSIKGLMTAYLRYQEIYSDYTCVKKIINLNDYLSSLSDAEHSYPGYTNSIDDLVQVGLDVIFKTYPQIPSKLENIYQEVFPIYLPRVLGIFNELLGTIQANIAFHLQKAHSDLNILIDSLKKGVYSNNKPVSADIYILNVLFNIINQIFCYIKHETKFADDPLMVQSYIQDIGSTLDQRLSELTNFLSSKDFKAYMLSLYEVLDLFHHKKSVVDRKDLEVLISIGIHYCSILELSRETKDDALKQTEEQGVNVEDHELLVPPTLAKFVSTEEPELPDLNSFKLEKTFSTIKKEDNVELSQQIFLNFGLKYSSYISKMIRPFKKPLKGEILHLVWRYPWILDLSGKTTLIQELLKRDLKDNDYSSSITIDRKHLIRDFMAHYNNHDDLIQYKIKIGIDFKDEAGYDAGGLMREFFNLMVKRLFNPDSGLFRLTDNKKSLDLNPESYIVPRHLQYLELAGFVLAKSISQGAAVDLSLSKPLLKHILGKNLSLRDLEDIDADLAKNLNWILTNENVEDIGMYFNYEKTVLGEKKVCDLIPDGSNIPITNENKKDFVRKMCEMKMKTEIEPQLNAFLRGFRHIYPLKWMAPFTPLELEILIGGPQKIDISSMRKTVVYKGYKETDTVIVWLWEFLEGLSQVQLSQFLYFLTGSLKVSYGGFEANPIKISHHGQGPESLPLAHTCYNELELPLYVSKEQLEEKILLALCEGQEGFHVR